MPTNSISGTSENVPAYPDEQIGYLASEQYAERLTPQTTGTGLYKTHSNPSQPVIESPLRKTSFPAEHFETEEFSKENRHSTASAQAIESEAEEEVLHIDDPYHKYNKISGGQETTAETDNLGPTGGNDEHEGWVDEHGYGVPILASDEVAKEVGGENLHPAISPRQDRRGSLYEDYRSGDQTPHSRPSSRPGSVHGAGGLSRFVSRHEEPESHTPLENVEEYEPLFPEEDGTQKPMTAADRFKKRPDALKHRFPSQDIWEDAPTSHLHVATVSTPDLTKEISKESSSQSSTSESSEQEASRKGEISEAEKAKLIPKDERLAKSQFKPHLRDDMPTRPGIQNRFPSQDIWEDSPESHMLVTTVNTPPVEDARSPPDASTKPSIPPRPTHRSKLGEQATEPSVTPAPSSVPTRPPKRLHQVPPAEAKLTDYKDKSVSPVENKKVPTLPDRPKPQIPARPAKKEHDDHLTKTASQTSTGSVGSDHSSGTAPSAKPKPAVPARPVGGKIASLQAGFLSNLNDRLKLGPQGPPPKEKEPEPQEEVEKAPLSDARKGRARGPQRRKPAASPSGNETSTAPSFSISPPRCIWHISNQDDSLTVLTNEPNDAVDKVAIGTSSEDHKHETTGPSVDVPKIDQVQEAKSSEAPPTMDSPLSRNTAGEMTDPAPASTTEAKEPSATSTTEHEPSPLSQVTSPEEAGQPEEESKAEESDPTIVKDEATIPDQASEDVTETTEA